MKCAKCTHFATKTTEGAGHFLLYGCRKKRLTFGIKSDWLSGKWQGSTEEKKSMKISDMPKVCEDYKK